MRADQKIDNRRAKLVVLVSDDHVRGTGNVAVSGVRDQLSEVFNGFRRDKIARTASDQMHRKRKLASCKAKLAPPIFDRTIALHMAARYTLDKRGVPMPIKAAIRFFVEVVR